MLIDMKLIDLIVSAALGGCRSSQRSVLPLRSDCAFFITIWMEKNKEYQHVRVKFSKDLKKR